MNSAPSLTIEQLTHALGEAVARSWGKLSKEAQHLLFDEAVRSHGEPIRAQLALFLHDKHPRTSDPVLGKRRDTPEPDSLGG